MHKRKKVQLELSQPYEILPPLQSRLLTNNWACEADQNKYLVLFVNGSQILEAMKNQRENWKQTFLFGVKTLDIKTLLRPDALSTFINQFKKLRPDNGKVHISPTHPTFLARMNFTSS